MPLLDRLRMLGVLDDSDDEQHASTLQNVKNAGRSEESSAVDEVGDADHVDGARFGNNSSRNMNEKQQPVSDSRDSGPGDANRADDDIDIALDDEDDYGSDDYASSESDNDDNDNDDDNDNMLEAEMRTKQALLEAARTNPGQLAFLGSAEVQRQRSKHAGATTTTTTTTTTRQNRRKHPKTAGDRSKAGPLHAGGYVPVKYPTGDYDAGEGFHVCGFHAGKRVYRLESLHIARLQAQVVRTAVGFCYLDTASMLPPKVVMVAAEAEATPGEKSMAPLPLPPSPPPSPPPPNATGVGVHAGLEVNGCFVIRRSALGGLGAFAARDLLRGEHILVEEPLVRTTLFDLPRALEGLTGAQRAQFEALAGHHPDANASAAERIWTANTFVAGRMEAIFVRASRFNHACVPRNNVGYHYERRKNVLIMTAIKRIAAGTELVITYGKSPSMLFERFGFRCTCGACSGFSEDAEQQY